MNKTVSPTLSRDDAAPLLGMLTALALCYKAGAIWSGGIVYVAALGLLMFAVWALLRPDLALVFVPLTAPLYLIPLVLPGPGGRLLSLQLHELVLLTATLAALVNAALTQIGPARRALPKIAWRASLREHAPVLLFLLAGAIGVLLAVERGAALREFRWLIVEPVIFYALLRAYRAERMALWALIAAGTLYAAFGILQALGLDVVPLVFGFKATGGFTGNTVDDAGVLRVTSVYGHPNNLALLLGRVWPLAVALGLRTQGRGDAGTRDVLQNIAWLAAGVCVVGLLLTASRGALLGAGAAALVLIGLLGPRRAASVRWILLGCGALALLAGLIFALRGGGSGAVRWLLWQEAAQYIVRHPLGIGLDQFYQYHNPEFGRSLIAPELRGTSEQFAAHPHNLILDTWLRLGPLGIIAFGWLLVRAVRRCLAARSALSAGVLAALAAALTHGLLDNFYFVPDLAFCFWLLLALADRDAMTPDDRMTG